MPKDIVDCRFVTQLYKYYVGYNCLQTLYVMDIRKKSPIVN